MNETSPLEITGRAAIAHLSARKEGKGDAKVLAVDLKLAVITSNELLISFHPQLRVMLYDRDGMPRFKEMGAVPWEREFHRMLLELRSDVLEKPIRFTGVKVYDFEFVAKEVGKVRAIFKAQIRPEQGEFESLGKLLAEPCDLTLHNLNNDLFAGNEAAAATTSPPSTEPAAAQPAAAAEPRPESEPEPEVAPTAPPPPAEPVPAVGEITEDILRQVRMAGEREAAKHEDDRDFDGGMKAIFIELKLTKDFVDEYLTELQGSYTEGWTSVPADV